MEPSEAAVGHVGTRQSTCSLHDDLVSLLVSILLIRIVGDEHEYARRLTDILRQFLPPEGWVNFAPSTRKIGPRRPSAVTMLPRTRIVA